jgi:transketolase
MGIQNPRQVYGEALVELGRKNKRIVVLDADLSKSTMSCLYQDAFPDRYFEMGIAEANMMSFAAGLSLTGKTAFVNSFAVFASGRAYDQIRVGICIPRLNVKIVGSSAGLSDFGDGATHQSVEDVALMRALPNMTVLVPADGHETRSMTEAVVNHQGPVYLRINRNDMPDVVPPDLDFEIGKARLLRDGSDAVIFAMGFMVSKALLASEILHREGLSARVVNVSTLKPLKDEEIRKYAKGMTGIVTAEEHSLIGGLANAVTYALRGWGIPTETVGITDRFGQSARSYDELLEEYGLTENHIAQAVRRSLGRVKMVPG